MDLSKSSDFQNNQKHKEEPLENEEKYEFGNEDWSRNFISNLEKNHSIVKSLIEKVSSQTLEIKTLKSKLKVV